MTVPTPEEVRLGRDHFALVAVNHDGENGSSLVRPRNGFELSRGDVHIWRVLLDENRHPSDSLWRVLDSEEMARVQEIKEGMEKMRFIRGRGVLRILLSRYCDLDPRRVRLTYGPRGKPILSEGGGQRRVRFSLSYSYGVVLYAFTADAEIGVDIEKIRPVDEQEKIVNRFFSEGEKVAYSCTSPMERQRAFFSIWTAKEAYSKMNGEGLRWVLSATRGLSEGVNPQTESWRTESSAAGGRASIVCLDKFPGFVAAVVVAGAIRSVKLLDESLLLRPNFSKDSGCSSENSLFVSS